MTTPTAKATKTSRTFRLECATTINVRATPERIWALLTNAADFPRWNSTVTRIAPNPDGSTTFSMVEVLSGVMLPMIKGSLPDFGPAFETYAADLKREAERTA
jgi:hypothetical protein